MSGIRQTKYNSHTFTPCCIYIYLRGLMLSTDEINSNGEATVCMLSPVPFNIIEWLCDGPD